MKSIFITKHFPKALFSILTFFMFNQVNSADWPTYQHDNQRSAKTTERLSFPLFEQWQYISRHAPQPAWPRPAKTDYWHREDNLKPRVIFDRAYHVVSVGDAVYFGSSANDKVYSLDARTGEERWAVFTGGPVRLAPAIFQGKVYVGSDDGMVYCLNGSDGSLQWKFKAATNDRFIPGNERMISVCPVRTGVLLEDGVAYFAGGIFPNEGVSLYALNAETGSLVWQKSPGGVSPQGYLLASASKLYVPTGRTTPVLFNRQNGKKLGSFQGNGGTYALLQDDQLLYGGGDLGTLETRKPNTKDEIASFNGTQIIITNEISYLRADDKISAIYRAKYKNKYKKWKKTSEKQRELANDLWDLREKKKQNRNPSAIPELNKKIEKIIEQIDEIENKVNKIETGCHAWEYPTESTWSMILAGDALIIGGTDKIEVIQTETGKRVWSQKVQGKVYSLAVANGRLLASTDQGNIYCFANKQLSTPNVVQEQSVPISISEKEKKLQYEKAAGYMIAASNTRQGYCLMVGMEDGGLAAELARKTQFNIICLEEDAQKVQNLRTTFDRLGLYGTRVTMHQGTPGKMPFTSYFANLIVSESSLQTGTITAPVPEIYRLLRPYGGVACFGQFNDSSSALKDWTETDKNYSWQLKQQDGQWAQIQRGELAGSGEWTHLYANPSNTACSMDQVKGPVQIQWFGRPGPRKIINRHSRPMSPLFKAGRLFLPANNRIISVDGYNGTSLWELEVPASRVLGALKDYGQMVLTNEYIYIAAQDECWAIDVEKGQIVNKLKAPQIITGEERKWGYLSTWEDQLFGTGKKEGASYYLLGRFNCTDLEEDFREMILSDYLFSLNRFTGATLWTYQNGVVFNNTITLDEDFVYFVESRNEKAKNDSDGRIRIDVFCESETYIVKLDQKTGWKIWEKPFHFPFQQIMYLSCAQDVLLAVGSYNKKKNVHYSLYAFDVNSGELIWKNSYKGPEIGGSHGEQWQHPVIIGDRIVQRPYDFDLKTGKRGNYQIDRGGHGCGGLAGSAYYLYGRGGNPRMYDYNQQKVSGTPLTQVSRPGCWINIIPAGGLVLLPESSSGCTCDYPVQTSFVFVPK